MGLLKGLLSKFIYMVLRVTPSKAFPPPLEAEIEAEYFKLLSDGDKSARNKLIEHNLRLVSHIVKKYYSQSKNQDDLTSIGSIGLIKAVDSFDVLKGAKFATYAAKCIQNEILMYFRCQKKSSGEISLSETIDIDKDGNPLTYQDIICIDDTIAEDLDLKISGEKATRIIDTFLEEREKQIIKLRYGIGENGVPLTQRELAARLNISRSYVSRIEKAALDKIRFRMNRNQL